MIPSRPGHPGRRHYRGAGPRPGAGRRAGAALFPALLEALLALRWEPSLRAAPIRLFCEEERGEGGGRRREAEDGPRPGVVKERATVPSPSLARSGRRPHAAHLTCGTGFRWPWARTELGRRFSLPPGHPQPRIRLEDRARTGGARGPASAGCAR